MFDKYPDLTLSEIAHTPKEKLLEMAQDPECSEKERRVFYAELEGRRNATFNQRHSKDDEPETL